MRSSSAKRRAGLNKTMKITLVTENEFKARETQEILNIDLEISKITLTEIQEMDLEKVALHKLNQAYAFIQKPVMIDDVSFEVFSWNLFPGPFVKWMLKAGNGPGLILKLLEGEKDRRAKARLAIGFHDGKKPHIFIGEANGVVSDSIRGDNGFGWDKVFIPNGYDQTFAEMPSKLKNSISHRGMALKKLRDFLKVNYKI